MRTPFIAGSWKMYKSVGEAVKYVKACRGLVKDITGVDMVIAPPFTALHAAAEAARNSNVCIAGQNLYWEREGAFTGEVSATMIAETGAEYVIVGHSERRTLFGETDASVNRKLAAAFAGGLTPLVCIGETLDQRERNETFSVLDRQIREGFDGGTADQLLELVIAYEPVWAIGTGRNATAQQAEEAHAHIRKRLQHWFGAEPSELCRIVYGGSVKPENIADLASQPDVDGALVGGASLDGKAVFDIVSRSRNAAV